MRRILIALPMMAVMLGLPPAEAEPLHDDAVLNGAWEYKDACAVCHGHDATGNGALAEAMKTPPPDLTRLSENNGGVFPFERVFQVIDGRRPVAGHGSDEMPVWGRTFTRETWEEPGRPWFGLQTEMIVAGRIYALARYLRAIQGGKTVPLMEERRRRRHWPDDMPRWPRTE